MTSTPEGFVPIFKGWNVWRVFAKDSLDFDPLMVGVSDDRRLQIFVEDAANGAPGVEVADPANPAALKGSQVKLLPSSCGLSQAVGRETVPGPLLMMDGPASVKFVTFYNRGADGVAAWPHDGDFLVDGVYQPSDTNPCTNGAAPPSPVDELAKGAGTVLKVVGVVVGVVAAIHLVSLFAGSRRAAAA